MTPSSMFYFLLFAGVPLSLQYAPSDASQSRTVRHQGAAGLMRAEMDSHAKILMSDSVETVRDGTMDNPTCSTLENKGSHFTVDVSVGTPPQTFSVVADTGSDSLIVASCLCKENGECGGAEGFKCFTGTNKSSTFKLAHVAGDNDSKDSAETVRIKFGSGTIKSVIASDMVKVGSLSAKMDEGVLLMVSKDLDFDSDAFEGILGLGPPAAKGTDEAESKAGTKRYDAVSFLETAGIARFSLCANADDSDSDGVLRLGMGPFGKPLESIGTYHWGVGFYGISIGNEAKASAVKFCSESDMKHGQDTPCGGIPDSGTTMITGPEDQVSLLQDSICDAWQPCRDEAKDSWFSKTSILKDVLAKCGEKNLDLNDMPKLHFHVKGADGIEQTLSFSGEEYVFEGKGDSMSDLAEKYGDKYALDLFKKRALIEDVSTSKVCMPAFGTLDYKTEKNGPVWILGTPLFYKFRVGFDSSHKGGKKPSVAFTEQECGRCGQDQQADETNLFAKQATLSRGRPFSGPARAPTVDVNLPL